MFGFLKKEEFISLGVNCDADFSNLSSITIALDFHELLITKAFLKDDILGLQKQSDEHNLGFKDMSNDFIWVSLKYGSKSLEDIGSVIYTISSGVKKEYETSELHLELYEKHIAPQYIRSLPLNTGKMEMDISEIQMEYWEKGVHYPLHFERSVIIEKIFKSKTGKIFRTLEYGKK
jgi:hypothetical protein